ncbi:MAG: hypothetical protein ABJA18_08755 [bacterium]
MSDPPQHAAFAEHLKTTFRVYLDDVNTLDTTLVEVSELLLSPRQEQFSIIFRGPNEPFLNQGNWRLSHDQLGEFELFLVPVSKSDRGIDYQAVFNRISTTG